MSRFDRSLVVALLITCVRAQTTWIVDAASGPGTHYLDLPPAVASAAVGDLVLVRPGVYSAVTLTQGIRILGTVPTNSAQLVRCIGISIQDVPAGQTVLIGGVRLDVFSAYRAAGRVLLEDVLCLAPVVVEDCALAVLRRFNCSALLANTVTQIRRSRVFVESSELNDVVFAYGYGPPLMSVEDSLMVVNASTLHGQNGEWGFWCMSSVRPRAAAELIRSTVYVCGGSRVLGGYMRPGAGCGSPGGCGWSMPQTDSLLVADPSTYFTCPPNPQAIGLPVPRVGTDPATAHGTLAVRCDAPPGSLAVLVASHAPTAPTFLPEGLVWVSPQDFVVLGVVVVPVSGQFVQSLNLTAAVAIGDLLAFQAALLAPDGRWSLSMPSIAGVAQ
ncbi:MAG: hypothetical protein IPK26_24955 [Planctomycetes bacterium]|nr:hypothetical protein [Planctomycetota bacterium]